MDKSKFEDFNLVSKYWKRKVSGKENVNVVKCDQTNFQFIEVNEIDLEYFNTLTQNNLVAQFTVLTAVFSFLLKKIVDDFDGIIVSNYANLPDPLFLSFSTDLNISFKEHLQKVKTEILETLHYSNLTNESYFAENSIDLNSLSHYAITVNSQCNTNCNGILFNVKTLEKREIEIQVSYLETFIKKPVVELILKHFVSVLCDLETFVSSQLNDYLLLAEIDKQYLLNDFNNTKLDYPKDKTIVDLFEEQVLKMPHNIAVIFDKRSLTYKELNEQSNQFALYLREKYDIQADDIIGIKLHKSDLFILAILGVLKSGGAYVPIDVNYPQERISYIEEDIKSKVVIDALELSLFFDVLDNYSKDNVEKINGSTNLAYVIYTSGTTGNPKGAMVEHTSSVNMSLDQIRSFEIIDRDKIVWFASVAFDASISEIMMAFYSGATLCIPSEETIKDKNQFVRFLKKTKSTVVTFPPSYLGLLSDSDISGLRCIITAGEPANATKAITVIDAGIDYYNAYGPTECAVCVSIYKVTKNDFEKLNIPIGKPIANIKIYILDDALQPVPIGVTGKLYVSGVGVARGYLGKPELTNEKFIENPFTEEERMYDTGDLACWLPEGDVEFLGRKDQQVKLRGYRIELGEIENTILQYSEDIKQVAVEVKEHNQEKVLIVYLVSTGYIDKTALRNFLQNTLPDYMVPGFYIYLEKLPLTPNGKIDRKSLPDISEEDIIRKEYKAPSSPVEECIAVIWQEVLGIDKIGVNENFFELGGHSLIISQVINRIQKQLGKTVSFKTFFASPTIESIGVLLQDNLYKPIPKALEAASYPLTASQSRLWVLSQLEGGSLAYNMPAAVTLNGTIDFNKFEESFQILLQRHEILRTYFKINEEGEVRQFIVPENQVTFKIEQKDFSSVEGQKEQIEVYLQDKNAKPFDLQQVSLLRASLLKMKEDQFVFFLSLHHIIGDGWSIEILISEVVKNYNALIQGKGITLPELNIQYKDYAVWRNEEILQEKHKISEQYWLAQFTGELPVLNLPSFKTRPLIQTYNGNTLKHRFSIQFLEKLKVFSKQQDVTLFMTLMAGINALLYRYTSQDDIIIGTPIAGREHPDLENQIGLYLNTLAIRTQIKERNNFLDLIKTQKEVLLGAYDHQNYPFDALVGKLNLKRDTSRSALFDVLVVLQNQEQLHNLNHEELLNLEISDYEFRSKTSQLDVSFTFAENDGLDLTIEYNTDIYEEYLIERMFLHFENLLSELLKQPESLIQEVDYLTENEKQQLLVGFNSTEVIYSKEKTIVDLFEEQVANTPDRVAVVFENIELSYKELNEKANQLAHYLRENYLIKPNDLIGIKLDRSEMMIVAILGILKSGAAYVPIDINYPEERIIYIEKDSKSIAVLDIEVLDNFKTIQDNYLKENIARISQPHDLAYVIYTSGTTGNPKGVMVEHLSVVSICENWKMHYGLDQINVNLLQLASISFDVFVGDICRSILTGGKMIICSNDVKLNPEHLYELMQKQKISILEGTPSLLLPLMEYINSENKDYSFFKILIFGSDSFNNQDYNALKDKLGNKIKIINSYGVTEATIDSTYYDDYKKDLNGFTPIGKAFSNTKIRILDVYDHLVPVGVYGEIYIGGEGLARGYFNNDSLTAEKFVENPFKNDEKLYKTGDLGRWFEDGNIDFIGRKDNQVKIRGYRIELGEIESALQKKENIESNVVLTRNDASGEKCLVAYIVSKEKLKTSDLVFHLQNILPNYMIPSYFVQIDSLPLTPNGKIDRKSLPDPEESRVLSGAEYMAPRNDFEKKLVAIWQEVLQVEKIGIRDNFFELGGHSLKVTKLLSFINKEFEVKVNFKDLFSNMILEDQVQIILAEKKSIFNSIKKVAQQASYLMSSSQRRLWLLSQFEGGNIAYNMPSIFEIKGSLDISLLEKVFLSVIERHESLRTVFNENELGEIRQFILNVNEIKFQLQFEDISKEDYSLDKLNAIIYDETAYIFDLTSDSLIRAKLIKTTNDTYVFSCVMHHIISDGWSIDIMINELFMLYDSYASGNKLTLPELKLQYKDYASWQQDQLKSDTSRDHKDYWLDQFKGELPVLDLPTYQTRQAIKTFAGDSLNKVYDKNISNPFKDLCQSQGATLFMGLLAAVKVLLYRYTDQSDIIVGSPIAGREDIDLQNQIGFYVNTLALRTQFNANDNFKELLSNIKDVTVSAYEHQIYPFDELVDHLSLKRDMSRNPLFDVMVTFQNSDNLKVNLNQLGNVTIKEYENQQNVVSKFDLEFIFEETVNGINLILVYNTDLYTKEFAENIINHLKILLQGIISEPELEISSLNFLSDKERNQVLVQFNDTKVDFPKNKTIIDLFREQVLEVPEKIAVRDSSRTFSYSELDKVSNQIASYLIAAYGEEDKSPIAVLADRSANMVVLLLGILKSGRAYIPLDPNFPKERLSYIVTSSETKILISEKNYELENVDGISILSLESILEEIKELKENLNLRISPDDTAYIIYTSGSTGNPKGVEIGHKSLLNFLTSMQQKPGIYGDDILFSVTTYSFDISILEFFTPLISGATVYIASHDILSDSNLVIESLKELQPTIIQATPSFYQMLFNADWTGNKRIKILCGGDLLSESLADKLIQNSLEVWNMYGPTETTIWSSVKRIEYSADASNIGKPISNTQFYIVDSFFQPKSIGTIGAIYIGGDGLAKGYYKNDSLTNEKFIKNPFSDTGLIYETGDVGKWNTKGEIEFLGRNDNQVKIRGYRIELGDIENALLKIPSVDSAVAVVKLDNKGNKRLIAYLISADEMDISAIKSKLREFLPDYMIPSFFIQLEEMPLTPNGKIDRKTLISLDELVLNSGLEYVSARNEVEEKLIKIWEEVLGIEKISMNDNFFELGGNSLSATKLISLIHKVFEVRISLNDLFKNLIVEEQAILIDNIRKTFIVNVSDGKEDVEIEKFSI
ncbi:amino acid adenylation domain-containing protein [Flavobacterium sp. 90]|uniref:non-ribosomal peptide synthetase n=1 Tax=unclassified Flavobacterium TaxID=196869 RepID=UPI000EB5C674|nr:MULTISPECIES: non-ribosomal peptide synthetase [unclassified Flavobacterium]RKR04557.1 amino acid adenylation domain-containing protein [Flavobacterium sp. 81]TCK55886.1 amino acid adenylation domain-containing protein [Flavobacterium sp. 90]